MNLDDIMLSEVSQSQKDKYCMIPLTYISYLEKSKSETESRIVVSKGWGGGWRVVIV